jgi:hypothetical protein
MPIFWFQKLSFESVEDADGRLLKTTKPAKVIIRAAVCSSTAIKGCADAEEHALKFTKLSYNGWMPKV